MKRKTLISLAVLAVVGLAIFFLVRKDRPIPAVINDSKQEVLPKASEDYLTRSKFVTDLESQGYVEGGGLVYKGSLGLGEYVTDQDNPSKAVYYLSSIDPYDIDNRQIYDTLKVDTSSFCSSSLCNDDKIWTTFECRVLSEPAIGVSSADGQHIYAAWVIDSENRVFKSISNLKDVYCYPSQEND